MYEPVYSPADTLKVNDEHAVQKFTIIHVHLTRKECDINQFHQRVHGAKEDCKYLVRVSGVAEYYLMAELYQRNCSMLLIYFNY